MNSLQLYRLFISFLLLSLMAACAPVKTLQVWKDDAYNQRLKKVLVIAVADQGYIRNQFENVLSNQLHSRGVEAIPSYKVLPQSGPELDRDAVLEKVRALGVENVLVARSIKKESIVNHQPGGAFFAPTASYSDGWYTYYVGSVVYTEREYDTDFYTISTNLFDVNSKKPVWSYLSQVKVSGSNQGAVNLFIPEIVEHLEKNNFVE